MRIPLVLAGVALVVPLAACGGVPAPAPTTAPESSASPTPTESAPALELPEDAVLAVTTTARAANGAELDLVMIVHEARAWDAPDAADLATAMTTTCEGALDASIYESNLWSFSRVSITATPSVTSTADWPVGAGFQIVPSAEFVALSAELSTDGFLVDDETVDPATPRCARDKFFVGAGSGDLVMGLQGDTDDLGASGQFTRWANHRFGFAAEGIDLSACTWTVTTLGVELNGDADWWAEQSTSTECSIGSAVEEQGY